MLKFGDERKRMFEFFKLLNAGCEDHARLISLSMDQSLSRSQRMGLKLHLMYCRACRQFRRDAHLMRETINMGCEHACEFPQSKESALPPESADAISASLNARMSQEK